MTSRPSLHESRTRHPPAAAHEDDAVDVTTAIGLLSLALAVGVYGTVIGAGGGFIMVPGLLLLFDLEGAEAVGTGAVALMIVGFGGAVAYDRRGLVHREVAGWFAVGAVPAAMATGWLLAKRIDTQVFTGALGVLLAALAIFVLSGRFRAEGGADGSPMAPRRGALAAWGLTIGATSGTFAVGGGLVTVPLLARLQGLAPHRASATTTATAMASSAAASVGHTVAGNVVWGHAAVLVLGAFVGSTLGARLAGRLAERTILVLLAGGLSAAAVPLLVDAVLA